jgi:SAM-dependent methyltransferase
MKADISTHTNGKEKFWNQSAREYAAYASEKKLYRESAEEMVRLAEIEPGMVVVDLACGTGIVSEAILKAFDGRGVRVVGIDFSPDMLGYAQRRLKSDALEFHCARAEDLSRIVREPVDRILCNAAFWHFDRDKVAAEISRVLKPSGRGLIGLPPQNFKNIDPVKLYHEDKRLWMLIEEMNLRGYRVGRATGQAAKLQASLDKNEVLGFLSNYGLKLREVHDISIDVSAREYVEFLRIPIMAKNSFFFNGVPDEEAQEIVSVVLNQLDWVEVSAPPMRWNIHVVEKEN